MHSKGKCSQSYVVSLLIADKLVQSLYNNNNNSYLFFLFWEEPHLAALRAYAWLSAQGENTPDSGHRAIKGSRESNPVWTYSKHTSSTAVLYLYLLYYNKS